MRSTSWATPVRFAPRPAFSRTRLYYRFRRPRKIRCALPQNVPQSNSGPGRKCETLTPSTTHTPRRRCRRLACTGRRGGRGGPARCRGPWPLRTLCGRCRCRRRARARCRRPASAGSAAAGPGFTARSVRKWLGRVGSQDTLHRAWAAVGERLHQEFQREVEGRSAGQRGLLYVAGGDCANGALQADLQPGQTAQLAGLPADAA